jgi:hypothetical protein
MSDARTRRQLSESLELLARCDAALPKLLPAIRDAMVGYPPSPRFDGDGGPSSTTFCELHERERCDCGRGTPFVRVSDRTGEAALRPDRAASDRAALDEAVALVARQAGRLVRILERYSTRSATESERRQTLADNERDESCRSCARTSVQKGVPRWEPASARVSLEAGGDPVPLCQWCYRWVRSEGSLPPVSSLEQHHRGQRVRRPA